MSSNIDIRIKLGSQVDKLVNDFYSKNRSSGTARAEDVFFLAYQDSTLVGCVRFCLENNTALLRTMMIDPSIRRKKIGSQLLQAFDHYLNENKISEIYCIPYDHLRDFYGQIGFKTADENTIPLFLQERLAQYRKKDMKVLCMKRSK